MKKSRVNLLLLFVFVAFGPFALADDYTGSVTFSLDDLQIFKANGFDYVMLQDGVPPGSTGAPALPAVQCDVAIPWNAELQAINILRVETIELEGVFDVVPLTAPRTVNGDSPDTSPFLRSFYMVFFISAGLWGVGNVILILLAAKQGVPVDLYEAADVDGAEWLCKYVKITLPMISPVIFYSLVIGLISSFQFFAAPFLVSAGGYDPDHPWMFFTVYMSTQLRIFQDLGYTATLGWLLAAFVGVVTLFIFVSSRRWVFYREG